MSSPPTEAAVAAVDADAVPHAHEARVTPAPERRGLPLPWVVREFVHALRDPATFRVLENPYLVFGFLWGLPIPVFSIGLDLWLRDLPVAAAGRCVVEHPFHLLFLAHPFLFAVVFGAMGTVRRHKDTVIQRLVAELNARLHELEGACDRLQDSDRVKSEFMANVTHELGTPLVSMRGYTQQVLSGRAGPLTRKQEEWLGIVERNGERLQALIEELLEASRIEVGRLRLSPGPVDVGEVIRQTASSLEVLAAQRGVAVTANLPPSPVPVTADRERIARVFLNLLSNAIKFTEHGGRVGVDLRPCAGGGAQAVVWDTGCGILPEHLPRVFDRFWQADTSARRRYGGTGLGLAIVKGILDAHGGTVAVESAPGRGSRFSVHLPACAPAATEGGRAADAMDGQRRPAALEGGRAAGAMDGPGRPAGAGGTS